MLCQTLGVVVLVSTLWFPPESRLTIRVQDTDGRPLPCRIHLKDEAGKPVRPADLPFWRDHFVCPGTAELNVPSGRYVYTIERGPEFRRQSGTVDVSAEPAELAVQLKRLFDLAADGWWSGELHVHRPLDEIPLHLRAEDLHVAPVITWWNGRNLWAQQDVPATTLNAIDGDRFYDVMAGEDEREAGALLYFGLKSPLPLPGGKGEFPEFPSPMTFVEAARQHEDIWIDIEKPFWWDVPVWLASGQVDSIGLANNHMCRSTMYADEAWGKPRDAMRLSAPRGNGYWTQEIYYHVLNCGLRIPPSAGSASGVLPNPVGYNRVYVQLAEPFTYGRWWTGLKAGRSFVTNGPLLLCQANGQLPGHAFSRSDERPIEIMLDVKLVSNDRVPEVELIVNGNVVRRVPVDNESEWQASIPLTLEQSGWFLVRAVTDNQDTFRFASTAPFYVEIGKSPRRSSQRSAQFFLDWVDERQQRVKSKLKNPEQLSGVLKYHDLARAFWQDKLDDANAD